MKILGIRFQNLNSLKGTFEIRFDKSPFLESGLFAITGATGAGKTTILDAITVALYGRVHRHDRDAFEIMTRHTTECYAEVEFEVKQKSYRAQWALRRSRGKVEGKLQDVKMVLSEVPSCTILESKLTETKSRIIELTGLDYNQFLRSVMLSQGDFTRFLRASEGERSELLEKITDTGIYSDISVWAFEKAKSEKKELEILRGRLNEVELLSTEELTAYQTQRAELHARELELRQVKGENENKLNWLQNISKLEIKRGQAYDQLQTQLFLKKEQQPAFQKLKAHQQAIVFKPALTEIQSNKNYSAQIAKTLTSLLTALPELQKQTTQANFQLQTAQEESVTAEKNWQEVQPIIEKVIQLDTTIQNTRTYYEQALEAATQLATETKRQTQEVQQKKDALNRINATFIYTQNWLTEHEKEACLEKELSIFERYITDLKDIERRQQKLQAEKGTKEKERLSHQTIVSELTKQQTECTQLLTQISKEKENLQNRLTDLLGIKTVAELEADLDFLPSLISLCEQQVHLSNQYGQVINRRQTINTQLASDKQALILGEETLKQFEAQKAEAETHLKDLQNLVELQMRIQKYEADRDHLSSGSPCPLCGSMHHPFTQNHPKNQVSEAEEKRNAYQLYVVSLGEQLTKQAAQVTALQTKITGETEQLQLIEKEIKAITEAFGHNNNRLPKPLEIEKPNVIEAVCRRKTQDLENLRAQLTQIREVETKIKDLDAALGQLREELVKRTSQVEQMAGTEEHLQQLLTRITDELQDLHEQQINITGEASSFLMQFNLSFHYHNADQLVTDLRNRAQEFTQKNKQFRELQLEQAQTQAALEKATDAIQKEQQTLETQQKTVEQQLAALKDQEEKRRELFGLKNPTTERNQLQETVREKSAQVETFRQTLQTFQEQLKVNQEQHAERTRELNKLKSQEVTLTQQLQDQLKSQGIGSVEELEHLFLAEEEAKRLTQLQVEIENNVASYQRLLKTTEEELKHERARQLTNEPESVLRAEIARLDGEISLLNREIGRLEQLLQRDTELKAQHQALAQKIEVQQKEFIRWDKLATLIGSADGKKFSKFAQGLTLARLVMLANQHLLKINKRYRILKNPQQDLDLQIVDTYQADAVRPMSTLSGGESFLVSLALALGLSDLAGRQAQIGSLFIDEGFGTLDAETLDMAITSLENLQASGKMIGIISHVEALKERISTQIQVVKMAGGTSKLKVVGHATDAYV